MTDLKEQMAELYQKMYELTNPECGACMRPHSCCDLMYCNMAANRADEFGVTLTPTGYHEELPYMSATGCTVPPHLRPLCTLHTCHVSGLGFKPNDREWTVNYFKLRKQIDELEAQWYVASANKEKDNE